MALTARGPVLDWDLPQTTEQGVKEQCEEEQRYKSREQIAGDREQEQVEGRWAGQPSFDFSTLFSF